MRRFILYLMVGVLTLGIGGVYSANARVQNGADLLQLLPDGNAVVVVDFQRVTSSALWPTLSQREPLKSAIGGPQSEITDLGIKTSDLHAVAIVFGASGFNNPTVAVRGIFDQSSLLSRIRSIPTFKLSTEKYKDIEVHRVARQSKDRRGQSITRETFFAFPSPGIIVLGGAEGVRGSIDVRDGLRPGVSQNPKLSPLVSNQPVAIRFAIAMSPEMFRSFQSSNLPLPDFSTINLVFGTVDISSGIDLDVTLRGKDAEHARAIAGQLNSLMDMAKGFLGAGGDPKSAALAGLLKTITIAGSDVDVKITGNLPSELLGQAMK